MYVCLCHGVTEKQLRESIQKGNETFCDIMQDIPIAGKCKKCVPNIVAMIEEEKEKKNELIYTEVT
jgi:bacterioferritin-associated ferredoxin